MQENERFEKCEWSKVSSSPGWSKAVKNYVAKSSVGDLREVKESLLKLLDSNGKCQQRIVHQALRTGASKLLDFILGTPYMNSLHGFGMSEFQWAARFGIIDVVQCIIEASSKYAIDLNLKSEEEKEDEWGYTRKHRLTAFHYA